NKHAAAFDVHRPHGIAEEHDGEDEPGRRLADRLLDDAADVIRRTGNVAEDDGRRSPVRNEGEHHAANDDHLGGAQGAAHSARLASRFTGTWHGNLLGKCGCDARPSCMELTTQSSNYRLTVRSDKPSGHSLVDKRSMNESTGR